MRTKKIRGHKRIWKRIDRWVSMYKDLDVESLKAGEREYAKIRVRPYSDLSILKSNIPSPKGATKRRILEGLVEIYEEWKKRLDQLGEPYYLRIWLFEPHFERSQVVCAVGGMIDFYLNTFFKPSESKPLPYLSGDWPGIGLDRFDWEYHLDEMHLTADQAGSPEDASNREDHAAYKKWFNKQLKRPHRVHKSKDANGKETESYSFRTGGVWLGNTTN